MSSRPVSYTHLDVYKRQGYDINDYAARLGEKWGVGQKGKDNGIVILIKPKSGREKGEVAISVGYGLEGVVPDITASRIIRNEIIPAFQADNYLSLIHISLTQGEDTLHCSMIALRVLVSPRNKGKSERLPRAAGIQNLKFKI